MFSKGFTILEMVVAIVIIGVALAGVMSVFSVTVLHSADPIIRKQLLVIAEEIMEEIELKPFSSSLAKTSAGCARNGFYKVADYDGYSTSSKICDVDGNAIPDLNGYSLSIVVTSATLGGVPGALQINVTVTEGIESISLAGWRLNYASP